MQATSYSYSAGNFSNTLLRVTMAGLQYDGAYFYRVGGPALGWSDVIPYRHKPKPGTEDTVKFLSYGDAGIAWSDGTNDYVSKDAATGEYSLLVNVGDISYANDYGATNNSWVNDEFFRRAQPYASRVPYMTAPGNHDSQFDFAAYLNRSVMPEQGTGPLSRFYYSFDWGPVHFLSFSTEHTFETGGEQWQFIKDDLERTASRRHITPWVVVWGHRPLYCTDLITWESRCVEEATQYREWLEGLFHQYHVDAYLCGHNHQLEYTKPVFNETEIDDSYHNAQGTVYIVNGAAGDKEGIDPTFMPGNIPWREWTSSLSLHTAYTRVTANQTALTWEFMDSDTGKLAKSFTMSKDAGLV